MSSIVKKFDVWEKGTHFGIIEYSTEAKLHLKFNTKTGIDNNQVNVLRSVANLEQTKGETFIDKALHLATNQLFTKEGGMRDSPSVRKVS